MNALRIESFFLAFQSVQETDAGHTELVEKMKGKTSVVSEKGKGSTFSFTLPVSQGTLSIKNSSTSTAPEAKPRAGKEKRIDSQGKAG